MIFLKIDFTTNNLFWTVVGVALGFLASLAWEKYKGKKRIFVSLTCQYRECGDDKRWFLFTLIHNHGTAALPLLEVDLKQKVHPDLKFSFIKNSDIQEIKAHQYLELEMQVTNNLGNIDSKWKEFFESEFYNSVFRIRENNSTVTLLESKVLAVRMLGQILYYYEHNFRPNNYWGHLSTKKQKEYIKRIEDKFHPKPNRFIKWLTWDNFSNYS